MLVFEKKSRYSIGMCPVNVSLSLMNGACCYTLTITFISYLSPGQKPNKLPHTECHVSQAEANAAFGNQQIEAYFIYYSVHIWTESDIYFVAHHNRNKMCHLPLKADQERNVVRWEG